MTDSVVSSLAARVRSNTVAKDSTTEFDETLDSFDPHESHAPLLLILYSHHLFRMIRALFLAILMQTTHLDS